MEPPTRNVVQTKDPQDRRHRLDIGRTGAGPMGGFLYTDAAKDEVLHGTAWTDRRASPSAMSTLPHGLSRMRQP